MRNNFDGPIPSVEADEVNKLGNVEHRLFVKANLTPTERRYFDHLEAEVRRWYRFVEVKFNKAKADLNAFLATHVEKED